MALTTPTSGAPGVLVAPVGIVQEVTCNLACKTEETGEGAIEMRAKGKEREE